MPAGRGLYIVCTRLAATGLSLAWLGALACVHHCIRKCLHKTGSLVFRASTDAPNRAVGSAHQAFVPRHGGCEPRKVDNGELSRIQP
jgi:hypothetical protein